MSDDNSSNSGIGQVVVNAKVTDQVNYDDSVLKEDRSSLKMDSLKKEVSQLANELRRTKSDVDYLIHDEFNAIKNYVDRVVKHDRLVKRP